MSFRIPHTGRTRPLALSAFSDDDEGAEAALTEKASLQQGTTSTTSSRAEQTEAAAVPIGSSLSQQASVTQPIPVQQTHIAQPTEGLTGSSHRAEQLVSLGAAHAEAQRWSNALTAWDAAAALDPGNAALHEMRAQVLLEVGRVWDAVQAATSATQQRPNWAPGWATLGRAQLALGEVGLGLASLEAAAQLDPGDGDLAAELVAVRVLAGQQRAAGLDDTRVAVL